MLDGQLGPVVRWLKRVITQPRDELSRWQRAARFAYDLGRYGARQLGSDRAPQMAAALSFRALFALLPVLIVATVLIRAIMGIDEFLSLIDGLLVAARLHEMRIIPPAEAGGAAAATGMTLRQWLEGLMGQAAGVNLAAVGWAGLVVVAYAAISLVVTIENAFNIVYRAPEGRSWTRRVPLYWFVLTVSPAALGLTAYVNGRFESAMESLAVWPWLLVTAGFVWTFVTEWVFMFAVYTLVPNTAVAMRPAAVGAAVAVVLLELGKRSMGAYLANAFSISQLYGSLGLIPLFMFWVYLMWLVVLFGLEVSAILQSLGGRELEQMERQQRPVGLVEPAAVVMVMEVVAEQFHAARPTTAQQIVEQTALPGSVVERMLERLMDGGVLHRLDREEQSVCLARPPEQISAGELIQIGFEMVDARQVAGPSAWLKRLRQAQRSFAAKTTLAALVPAPAAGPKT